MKATVHALALLAVLFIAVGCKPSNRVTFKPANMSIDPGEGWKVIPLPPDATICSPCLVGQAGMIKAIELDRFTDIKEAAKMLQANFSHISNAVPDSFKQEDFTTDSGLAGIHLSFTAKGGGTNADFRGHTFITHNMLGKCVGIDYNAPANDESPVVLESIRKTLRVE